MRLRYTLPALADLTPILDYIAERSPQGAARIHTRIRTVADLLLRYPLAGAVTDDPISRRITTTPYPYLIFYEAADAEIIIRRAREILVGEEAHFKPRSGRLSPRSAYRAHGQDTQ